MHYVEFKNDLILSDISVTLKQLLNKWCQLNLSCFNLFMTNPQKRIPKHTYFPYCVLLLYS